MTQAHLQYINYSQLSNKLLEIRTKYVKHLQIIRLNNAKTSASIKLSHSGWGHEPRIQSKNTIIEIPAHLERELIDKKLAS